MKKEHLFILLLVLYTTSYAQNNPNPLIGHYYLCSEEGYSEFYFTDSLMRYLPPSLSYGMTYVYKVISDNEILNTEVKDTTEFEILSNNKIILKSKENTEFYYCDTLTRFQNKILNYQDYDCSMKISDYKFSQILWHEFEGRRLKYGQSCLPTFLSNFQEDTLESYDLGELITPEKKSNDNINISSKYFKVLNFETQFIGTLSNSSNERILNKITYNNNETEALIEIDEFYYCYEEYSFHAIKLQDKKLYLRGHFPTGKMAKCFNKCQMKHYILLEVDGKIKFDEVFMNRKPVDIN